VIITINLLVNVIITSNCYDAPITTNVDFSIKNSKFKNKKIDISVNS